MKEAVRMKENARKNRIAHFSEPPTIKSSIAKVYDTPRRPSSPWLSGAVGFANLEPAYAAERCLSG
jgi:hypothetical protein